MGSNVFYRRPSSPPKRAARGDGIYIFDSDGKEYIDGSGGALVVNVGHGVAEISHALASQAEQLAYVNGLHFTNEAVESLAERVSSFCPHPLNNVFPLSSGSAATEAVIKLARQYWWDSGKKEKYKVVARFPGYHGNTLAALSASGRPSSRRTFEPLLQDFLFIPAPMAYRCPEGMSYEDLGAKRIDEFAKLIEREGADSIAAFIAEPVIGASAGGVIPPEGYFSGIRSICTQNDILFVADEVLTGMGRTGDWLAITREGVTPDILTLGKGLSGGYAPLSALVVSDEIVQVVSRRSGSFSYNQTFSHTPVSAAAGVATIDYLRTHQLVDRSRTLGAYFLERLQSLKRFDMVGDVRGIGLLAGVEYVADKATQKPFEPERSVASRVFEAAFDEGLILWSTSQFLESGDGDLSVLGPPFVITETQVDELVSRLARAIETVEHTLY